MAHRIINKIDRYVTDLGELNLNDSELNLKKDYKILHRINKLGVL